MHAENYIQENYVEFMFKMRNILTIMGQVKMESIPVTIFHLNVLICEHLLISSTSMTTKPHGTCIFFIKNKNFMNLT